MKNIIRIFVLFYLALLLFSCGGTSTDPDYTVYNISESEYNDSLLFSQYIGDYGINSIINISGQIEDSNDFDVYKFRILKPSKISIKLSFDDITNSQTDFDFIVYRENIYFASAESSIEPEELTFIENFEYTEFAVKVYSYSEIGDYDLKLTISTSGYGSISGKLTPSSNYSINSNFSFKPKSKSAGELKSMAPGKFLCKYRNGDSSNNYKPSLSQKKYSLNAGNNLKISAIRDKKIFDNIFSGTFIIDGDDSDPSIFKASQPNTNRALDYKKNMSELLSVSEKFTKKLINILGNNNEFEYVEPDYIYGICSIPNDLYFKNQWNILNLNVPAAWNFSAGSDTIIIAVIDTGIKPEHPEFANRLVWGFDFISEISSSNDGDGIDANPDDSGDGISSSGNSYHGTHVAGIIASNSNNSQGISGISYNCKIMPLRALGKNGGLTSDIMEAVKFAAGLSNVSGIIPAVPAKIINMSLGGEYYSRSFEELLNTVNNMNITVVCAAGNENSQSVFYPAGYSSTISVAAVDYNNNKSFYSNYGGHIDISAPGGDMTADLNKDNFQDGIISAFWNETGNTPEYQLYQGTSQAAAHISGICGLIISANPHLTAQEVKNLLYSTASDLGATGRDNYYGYGLADAYRAVSTACGSVVYSPANTILSANTIDMYLPEDSVVINIYNTGVDTLIVTGTSVSDLRCTADIINSNNTYKIRFRIDANSFSNANDSYLIQSLIYSNAGTDTVLIYVHTSQTLKILTDEVFVLILDPDDNFKTVRETSTNYFKNFEYSLSNIPAGRYYLAAGTDKNNNNSLGDIAGEYIGFYPLFTDRKKIVVEPNIKLSGLNFEIFKTASGF